MTPKFMVANGLNFGFLEEGPRDGPLVICAHGFPDSAWSFVPTLQVLGKAGYWAIAPFMRGYLPTAIPQDRDYRATTLARDLIALIEHFGVQRAVLVGHDWGAAATYAAAAMRPDRLRGIVCGAIPHLRRFLLRPTTAQLRRSRYMLRFQWPDAEQMLSRQDFLALRQLAASWSPGADLDATLAPVLAGFREPGRLSAALGYYRALPRSLLSVETWQLLTRPVQVPACIIYGTRDGCIAPEMFRRQAHLFAASCQQVEIENAGHFMQVEQPQRFAEAVLSFIRGLDQA